MKLMCHNAFPLSYGKVEFVGSSPAERTTKFCLNFQFMSEYQKLFPLIEYIHGQ